MLPRVLEPEVMDTPDEARDYDAMDHSAVNRVFVADFLAVWDGRGPILDLGTGTARIPIEFCQQSPNGEVVAVDAAAHMLALAEANVRRAGFAGRIHYIHASLSQRVLRLNRLRSIVVQQHVIGDPGIEISGDVLL